MSVTYPYWHLNHIWKSYQNTRSCLLQRVFLPTFASGSFSFFSPLNKGEHFISFSHASSQPAFPYPQVSPVHVKMCSPCVNKQRSLHICLLLKKRNIKKVENRAVFWSPVSPLFFVLPLPSATPLSPKSQEKITKPNFMGWGWEAGASTGHHAAEPGFEVRYGKAEGTPPWH